MANYTSTSPSMMDRLRREMRNPSLLTGFLVLGVGLAIILAIFAPGWVSTARESFRRMSESDRQRDESMIRVDAVVPSQITPWLAARANEMANATTPAEWRRVSFRTGPCSPDNLVQLPAGQFSDAVRQTCTDLDAIQLRYAPDCSRAGACNIPETAKTELAAVVDNLFEAFQDAGFVLPYSQGEQPVGP